jgi:membrane protease subunit HflK
VARFNSLFAEYSKAPEVTRRRIYIETMQDVMPGIQAKILVDDEMNGLLPLLNLDIQKGGQQ